MAMRHGWRRLGGLWRPLQRLQLALALLLLSSSAIAEPWLSTRYAQNCAACHAPGRKNLKPADRRCTLSCQGCHVNPNGGGLRSQYGKWNEDRWLRSFRSDALRNEKTFATVDRQHYGEAKDAKAEKDARGKDRKGKRKADDGKRKRMPVGGFPLVELSDDQMNEERFKRDGREFEIVDRQEFVYQIPQKDPYRLLDVAKTDAGADIRWQWTKMKRDDQEYWSSFLMSADFALRWRPLHKDVHVVYEARSLGSPAPTETRAKATEQTLQQARTRSLYVLVDNLPFNTFVMGGYYKPLFGNVVPDHYALAQELTTYAMTGQSKNYSVLYSAVSAGTAPNVPYLNVHMIQRNVNDPDDRTQGFATNLGMRFVTLGASTNYSYWRTTDKRNEQVIGVEMHSLNLAARFFRTVTSLEAVSVSRDDDTQDFRQGGVYALDTYTQMWRENYFTLMYAMSNVASDITPGSANQVKTGFRSFVIPGVDLWLLYELRNETKKDEAAGTSVETKLSGLQGQIHLFF